MIEVHTPAKLNLFLKVLGRRADGYHDIVSLMVPIDLHDRLEIELARSAVQLRCPCGLPEDSRNLAFRAATVILEAALERDISAGTRIYMEKHIPVAAGMGGGSSDAAAVLTTLNRLMGSPFSLEELEKLGLKLGADVPFFIRCQPAIACGIGEELIPVEVPKQWYVLVNPGFPVETKKIYRNLALSLTGGDRQSTVEWLSSLSSRPADVLRNDLETSAFALFPELALLRERLAEAGARNTLMTGSGPTMFALFDDEAQARLVAGRIRREEEWAVLIHSGPSVCALKGEADGSHRGESVPGQ
jgi:4-diphosphocytidyl-2-C-methyl-D-erythritol kinase